jgi:hypothetical protein
MKHQKKAQCEDEDQYGNSHAIKVADAWDWRRSQSLRLRGYIIQNQIVQPAL